MPFGYTWDSLHPAVVHFPIALLLVAPLFLLGALAFHRHAQVLLICALTLTLLGTAGALVALSTGEATADVLPSFSAEAEAAIGEHEELAEPLGPAFSVLTVVLLMLTSGWRWVARRRPLAAGLLVVYLFAHTVANFQLIRTAKEGGRVVHQFGVTTGAKP